MEITMFTDGGARGNPGPAATGVVIKNEDDEVLHEFGNYLGTSTNNEAEYKALIAGLDYVAQNFNDKPINLSCYLDSELVVKQLNGLYKVKSDTLRPFYLKAVNIKEELTDNGSGVSFNYVPRKQNKHADSIVNKVLDEFLSN